MVIWAVVLSTSYWRNACGLTGKSEILPDVFRFVFMITHLFDTRLGLLLILGLQLLCPCWWEKQTPQQSCVDQCLHQGKRFLFLGINRVWYSAFSSCSVTLPSDGITQSNNIHVSPCCSRIGVSVWNAFILSPVPLLAVEMREKCPCFSSICLPASLPPMKFEMDREVGKWISAASIELDPLLSVPQSDVHEVAFLYYDYLCDVLCTIEYIENSYCPKEFIIGENGGV